VNATAAQRVIAGKVPRLAPRSCRACANSAETMGAQGIAEALGGIKETLSEGPPVW
jgi:hypothetical protein